MSRGYEDNERAMVAVQRRQEGNTYCADCGGGTPEFVNLTVGTFICKECADVHRSISNRRIKDIYGRDLTPEDIRRMADVGNDKANRRFLATWDPVEFPEPDPADKERLQNFIWLKYEGSWKKAPALPPTQRYERDVRDSRYGRERELFQDVSHHRPEQEQQLRSVWAERLGRRPQQALPPPVTALAPRHDDYRRYEGGVERFAREPAMNRDRFRTPPHTGYSRRMDGGLPAPIQSRYREEYDEEYDRRSERRRDSGRSDRRDSGRSDYRNSGRTEPHRRRDETGRRKKSSRYASEEEDEDFNDNVVEKRRQRKTTKSRREAQDSDEESSDEDYASRSKKIEKKKKKSRSKTTKKKRRDESESDSDDVEEEDDVDSLPSTTPDSVQKGKTAVTRAQPAKAEFDLMSDWMGAETETNTTAQSSTSAVTQPPTTQAGQMQMTPQQGVQMPHMVAAPPMSMYGGMMSNPHAAYMTGMPYYMTGLPMGMGMGGMQMMPPPHPQMGMPGVMSGMAAMNLGGQQQAQAQQQPPPPPPPPQMQHNGPVPPPPQGPPPS